MWLGTEDGTIHIYNCTDNIRQALSDKNVFFFIAVGTGFCGAEPFLVETPAPRGIKFSVSCNRKQ